MTTLLAAALAALAAWLATPRPHASHRLATLRPATASSAHTASSAFATYAAHTTSSAFTALTAHTASSALTGAAPATDVRAALTSTARVTPAGATAHTTGAGEASLITRTSRGGVVAVRSELGAVVGARAAVRGGMVAAAVDRARARGRRREAGTRWAEAGIELCQSMAAELRAGRTPGDALRASVEVLPAGVRAGLRGVSAAASAGGDVPAELTAVADGEPGAAGLRQVAAAWRVGAGSGSGLADVLERVAQSLRDDQSHRAQVTAQLAGPRATARLLAALPVLGLGLAAGSGAHPLDFLFGTPAGLICLAVGLGLDALGLWWSTQITRAALTPSQ